MHTYSYVHDSFNRQVCIISIYKMHRNSIEDSISIYFNTSAISCEKFIFRMETCWWPAIVSLSLPLSLSQRLNFGLEERKELHLITIFPRFFVSWILKIVEFRDRKSLFSLREREIKEIIDDFLRFFTTLMRITLLVYFAYLRSYCDQGKPFATLFTGSFKHWHPHPHTHTHTVSTRC